jgi:LysR family hydrogen peroxide-inducible transcriptional activator
MKLGAHLISLRQLQYVVAVAETKGFRQAADRCHVSQPSLSAQIAEAESALGVRLFERDRRRVLITPAGAEIIARARTILVAVDDLVAASQRHADPLAGTIRLGVIPTIGPYLLPDLDPALRREYPRIELLWTEDKTENLVARVQAGELDAALVALESELGDLEHVTIGEDPFVLATARGHALGRKPGRAKLGDLRDASVLLLDDGHCFREQALDFCAKAGAQELGFRATSLMTLCRMVAGGSGITLLPRLAVATENRGGALAIRELAPPVPHRTLVLAWRRGSAIAESLGRLAASACKVFSNAGHHRGAR